MVEPLPAIRKYKFQILSSEESHDLLPLVLNLIN